MFKEKLNVEIINLSKDQEGQILKYSVQFEQDVYQIINIYAPTKPSSKNKFYKKLLEKEKTILAGDFNMVENLFLDRLGGNPSKTHMIGFQKLNESKTKHKLVDIWRKINSHKRLFTYHNADKTTHSRID